MKEKYTQLLIDNFFRYVAISSQSLASNKVVPTSEGQRELANLLAKELKELKLENIKVSEQAVLTAYLAGNKKDAPKIGYIAHLDTVDVNLSANIKPQILNFKGEDLVLNEKENIVFKVSEHPEVAPYINDDIIFSDGTSVLGADNKSAISIIMTAIKYIKDHNISHGDIYVAFVPDEEIGLRGAKAMDLKDFPVDFAYTIDCCGIGEVVYETFNAAHATIDIKGVTAHPMSAKNVLVNPLLIATDIINEFDRTQTPECTEGKEGYIWNTDLTANAATALLSMAIRDFDKKSFEARKNKIIEVVEKIQAKHPKSEIKVEINDVYMNILDSLTEDKKSIDVIFECMKELNIEPKNFPMRGGTDGSYLSAKGISTPNYFTGAHNFHSNFEFLPIKSFEKSFELTLAIIDKIANLK